MKKWYKSKAVWGGLVSSLAGLAGVFGFALDSDTQMELTNLCLAVGSAVGGVMAIYGRVRAVSCIKRKLK
jgi:hypothetical protein